MGGASENGLQPPLLKEVKCNSHLKEEEQDQRRKKYELQITEDLEEFLETPSDMSGTASEAMNSKAPKKRTAEPKPSSKQVPIKKKLEPNTLGPMREREPWDWISLNKCLVLASFLALLSMGFQILQDVVDPDDELPELGNGRLLPPECCLPVVPPDELPEPWFFESWFEASEPEPGESEPGEDEEKEVIPTPATMEVDLKTKQEKPASPRKSEAEVQIERHVKEKQEKLPAKIEKAKQEKASKELAEPRDKQQQAKANKPRKELKEAEVKREDNNFLVKEWKVRGAPTIEKRKEFKKDKVENGRPQKWDKQGRSEKTARVQNKEYNKRALKKDPPEDRRRKEHTPQRNQKWPRKDNPRGLNGSSRQNTHHKFFPQKEDEKRRFFPKSKNGAIKPHD
ncbi:junctional sarcoplasmic reticulum protein 1 isoform X2 [Lissotriton helveticus]